MLENKIKTELPDSGQTPLTAGESEAPEAGKAAKTGWIKLLNRNKNKPAKVFDAFKAAKFIYPLTIILIVSALGWILSFLYHNVYLTMTQAEIVSSLKTKVIEESVDSEKFSAVVGKIVAKKKLSSWAYFDYLASPFSYGARTAYPNAGAAISPATTSPAGLPSSTTKSTSTKR